MSFDTNTLLIVGAVILVLILGFLVMRPRRQAPRIEERAPEGEGPYVARTERPYMAPPQPKEDAPGKGLVDEVATATTDVAGEVIGIQASPGAPAGADDLGRLKGVGPKLVARLNELGIHRYAQLAGLNANEAAHLEERLGPFQGRLGRDRVIEQADYLARGDIEGFEAKFGKLGG